MITKKIHFLTVAQVLLIHDQMVKRFGGSSGVRDLGLIESAVARPKSSFDGQYLYSTIFDKAGALLQSLLKNHPFVDGNKRNGAYAFIWFLQCAKILDLTRITPPALTAITLLIAESAPKDKDKMIGLVCAFLTKRKTNQF